MAKAKVVEVHIDETGETEYDVELMGSDPQHTSSTYFYCGSKKDAEELAKRFNALLKESRELYEVY